MSVLGLDLGKRRIGVACSDESGRIALPQGAIERHGTRRDLAEIKRVIRERGILEIVVGLPVHMNGREGPEAREARAFAEALAKSAGLPVHCLDERWSSVEAERTLRDATPKRSRRRGARKRGQIDAAAASLILSTYLARKSAEGAET